MRVLGPDITGLMVQPKDNWQERVAQLSQPEHFSVKISCSEQLWGSLTEAEQKRLKIKMELVSEYASYMAAGMLKGTVKYKTDDYSVDQWMAHLIGEGADQSNYAVLLYASYQRFKQALEKHVDEELEAAVVKAAEEA